MSDHSPDARGWTRLCGGIGLATFAALAVYTLTRPRGPFYDEVYHLAHAADWFSASSLRAWLTKAGASAVGPFYGMFYQRFFGATGWPVPWIRGPNLFFLGYTIAVLAAVCRRRNSIAAWSMMAVPMTWVIAGMALTEMPAIAMLATAVYAADALMSRDEGRGRRAVWWAVFGLAFGIAVAVRQSVLIVMPALLLLAAKRREDWVVGAAVLTAGLAPMLAVFWMWRGLLPPGQAHVGGGFSVAHALYGFAYVGLVSLLLAPQWWWSGRKLALGAGAAAIVFNALSGSPPLTMLSSVLRVLGPRWASMVERGLAAATIAVGGAFIGLLAREARWQSDRRARGLVLGTALVCLSCGAIAHQFSSRYVTLALPFCVPLLAPKMTFGPWTAARLASGALVGFAVLRSYYNFPV